MTVWLDAHFNPHLAAWLGSQFGVIGKALKEIGLHRADDQIIFDAARRLSSDIAVMTKDEDFVQLVRRHRAPARVIWVRCGNISLIEYQVLLKRSFSAAVSALNAGAEIAEIVASTP